MSDSENSDLTSSGDASANGGDAGASSEPSPEKPTVPALPEDEASPERIPSHSEENGTRFASDPFKYREPAPRSWLSRKLDSGWFATATAMVFVLAVVVCATGISLYGAAVNENRVQSPVEALKGDGPKTEACTRWAADSGIIFTSVKYMEDIIRPYYEAKGGEEEAARNDIGYPEEFFRKRMGVGAEAALEDYVNTYNSMAVNESFKLDDIYGSRDELARAFDTLSSELFTLQVAIDNAELGTSVPDDESLARTYERSIPDTYSALDSLAYECRSLDVAIDYTDETAYDDIEEFMESR